MNEKIIAACREGNIDYIVGNKKYIDSYALSVCLGVASGAGQIEVLSYFMENFGCTSSMIFSAIKNSKDFDVVDFLLPWVKSENQKELLINSVQDAGVLKYMANKLPEIIKKDIIAIFANACYRECTDSAQYLIVEHQAHLYCQRWMDSHDFKIKPEILEFIESHLQKEKLETGITVPIEKKIGPYKL